MGSLGDIFNESRHIVEFDYITGIERSVDSFPTPDELWTRLYGAAPLPTPAVERVLAPFYHDYQLALRYRPTPRDDLDLLIFGSGDRITTVVDGTDPLNDVDLVSNIYFTRARLRWTHRFHKDLTLTLTPSGGVDTFRLDTGSAGFYGAALTTTTRTLTGNLRAELSGRTTLGGRESRSGSAVVGALRPKEHAQQQEDAEQRVTAVQRVLHVTRDQRQSQPGRTSDPRLCFVT